jgi:bifunctional non-homologous end joining protein LigD
VVTGKARKARRATSRRDTSTSEGLAPSEVQALRRSLTLSKRIPGGGPLALPGGGTLAVSNLRKVFWPELRPDEGRPAPALCAGRAGAPAGAGRPAAGDEALSERRGGTAVLPASRAGSGARRRPHPGRRHCEGPRPHVIGGSLATLLYTAQLASISQDPWFSRIGHEDDADDAAFDLDPPEGAPFDRVLDVARWLRDELHAVGAIGFPKTSGAGGLHVYVRLPPRTPYEACQIYAQIVATVVAAKHPKAATVERALRARGQRVYVDFLQNARGKTLASAYSVRANSWAGVSTPLTWDEVDRGVSPRDFTLPTFADRLRAVGDLWAGLRSSPPADLLAVSRHVKRR